MATTGQKCREEKKRHPERYCSEPGCLWRVLTLYGMDPQTGEAFRAPAKGCVDGRCPRHKRAAMPPPAGLRDENGRSFAGDGDRD